MQLHDFTKRTVDLTGALLGFLLLGPVLCLTLVWILIVSGRPVLHWSRRVGKNNLEFLMPKVRTMSVRAPQLATHLLPDPEKMLLPGARLIRGLSLDEIPQLWCVFTGSMSLVGPRPALFNQNDLVEARTQKEIHRLVPGITGWAQIRGRDELSVQEKVKMDFFYLKNRSLWLDFQILAHTLRKVVAREGVVH